MNPKLIVEILSPSIEPHDRSFKFQQYQKIASLEEYVLVSQVEPLVERYCRRTDLAWADYAEARGRMGLTIELKSLGLEIKVEEIYRNRA